MFGLRIADWVGIFTICTFIVGAFSYFISQTVAKQTKPMNDTLVEIHATLNIMKDMIKDHSSKFEEIDKHLSNHDVEIALLKGNKDAKKD